MVAARVVRTEHEGGKVVQFSQARTHLGRPIYWVSSYLVDGVLIDAGPRWTRDAFLHALGGAKVESVWVTHHHEDHVGNVASLQARFEAPAYASSFTARRARERGRIPWYRRHTWGDPEPGTIQDLPRRINTRHHAFVVVPVPGHTPGDVAFVEESQGWAFTGDLFLSPRQVTSRGREDLGATIDSLRRLAAKGGRTLFTGMRVFDDAADLLAGRIEYIQQVRHDLQALRKQGLTQVQARRRLLGRERFIHYFSGGDFSKQHFADQALALKVPPVAEASRT